MLSSILIDVFLSVVELCILYPFKSGPALSFKNLLNLFEGSAKFHILASGAGVQSL